MVLEGRKSIYIAGPLFSQSERRYLEFLVDFFTKELNKGSTGLNMDKDQDFFLPHRDAGDAGIVTGGNEDVFMKDLKYLDDANIIIAWLDGSDVDSGTAAELGYAFAKGKHIFAILTDRRRWVGTKISGLNNMIWGICKGEERIYKINDTEEKERMLHDLSTALREAKEIKLR
jgi:nucleoside 2-deoxyribosyltransferase